ncbi:uncharacterized protein [Dysidea avara]|uniref:uncharacterized protein n=1 Tax=Dysidea avara TaxID=196820 RepID=UPI00332F17AB
MEVEQTINITEIEVTDSGILNCSIIIDGVEYTSEPYDLQVSEFVPSITLQPSRVMQAMVGEMQDIVCSVTTAFGTDISEVTLTWVGPDGSIIEDDRVSIIPTFTDGNTYTTILQFDYLMEGDEGVYTCDITIGENVETLSVELQNITIPTPVVNLIAVTEQISGQSLTLECNATAVRGITSSVDISILSLFSLETFEDVDPIIVGNSAVYSANFTLEELTPFDNGRLVFCLVNINGTGPVALDQFTLDVIGKGIYTNLNVSCIGQ